MYKINLLRILVLLLLINVIKGKYEEIKNNNKEFVKCSTIIYDQILIIYNTIKKKEINNEERTSERELSFNNGHFLVNLTSTIDLNQIYSNISVKKNIINNKIDLYLYIYDQSSLNAVATIDKFHSNSEAKVIKDAKNLFPQIYTINLDKEKWTFKYRVLWHSVEKQFSGRSIISTDGKLYIYGGWILDLITNYSLLTDNFINFDVNLRTYKYPNFKLNYNMPPNAFYTATIINSTTMAALGGISYNKFYNISPDYQLKKNSRNYYNESTTANLRYVYLYTLESGISKRIETINYDNRTRAGHSATYLSDLNCILVYGGTDRVNDYTILYNDIQLLNLNNWEWTTISIIGLDNETFNIGRAWHSSELINNKLVFFYGDINYNDNNNDDRYNIIAIDLKTIDLNKKTVKLSNTIGPATKNEKESFSKLYTSGEYLSYENDMERKLAPSTNSPETDQIIGILIAILVLSLIIYCLIHCYKRAYPYKKKEDNDIATTPSPSLHSLKLSQPNAKDGDEYGIWELNSHYSNSSINNLELELNQLNDPIVLNTNIAVSSNNKTTKINSNELTAMFTNNPTINNTNFNSFNNFK